MTETRLTLGQKITKLIAESPFKNPLNFHKEIVRRYGEDAMSQRHLYNVINDHSKRPKEIILSQIAFSLKIKFYELIKGTTSEPPTEGPSRGIFPYGPKSDDHLAILRDLYHGLPFIPQMIKMKRCGKTIEEREEKPGLQCFKFVVVIRGLVELTIKHQDGNAECIKLKLDDCHSFNSGEFHYFENKGRQFSKILIIKFTTPIQS